ncbi:type II secretion system GspH family protein [Patescibacteria group bacterium]|nr:type II secretion system GspH family protein [Patescibacteria group bacterium]
MKSKINFEEKRSVKFQRDPSVNSGQVCYVLRFDRKTRNDRLEGFTLIELLVGMFIIAMLTGLLLPNFMGARERARDASRKQDLNAMKNALRIYYNDNQAYPTGTSLDANFSSYMPGIVDIGYGYTYAQVDNGDGFRVSFGTEATKAEENGSSQLKCGVGTGSTDPDIFMICGN